jgi:hypothetical protein
MALFSLACDRQRWAPRMERTHWLGHAHDRKAVGVVLLAGLHRLGASVKDQVRITFARNYWVH